MRLFHQTSVRTALRGEYYRHERDSFERCKTRYIVIFNPELRVTRKENGNQRVEKAKMEIKELNSELSEAAKDINGAPSRTRTCAPGSGGRRSDPLSYRRTSSIPFVVTL